ncbi:MAG: hypothetical protein ACRDIU_01445 [Actinomycetota bacterium]
MRILRRFSTAAVLLMLVSTACGSDEGADVRNVGPSATASGTGSGTGTGTHADAAKCEPFGDSAGSSKTVNVKLQEWAVLPDVAEAPAGKITFKLQNTGDDPHEFLVVKTDDPSTLPVNKNGSFDEAAYGEDKVLGEVEPFPAKSNCEGTFEMAAGNYALVCNIEEMEQGKVESHFQLGMRTAFKVT